MAQWKKIIVSGSQAELQSLVADNLVQVGSNQIISSSAEDTILSGSFSGSFQGDGSGLTGITPGQISLQPLNAGAGLDGGPYDGSTEETFVLDTGSAHFKTGVEVLTTAGDTQGTFKVDGEIKVVNGLEATDAPTFAALTVNGTISGSGEISGSALNIASNASIGNNITVGGDATIEGDLIVQGDVTAVQTTNLQVQDKYVLLNSGSSDGKGGIVVDGNGAGVGRALVLGNTEGRWGFTGSLDANSGTGITPDAFAVAVTQEATTANVVAEYTKVGNLNVDSAGDIWIYA